MLFRLFHVKFVCEKTVKLDKQTASGKIFCLCKLCFADIRANMLDLQILNKCFRAFFFRSLEREGIFLLREGNVLVIKRGIWPDFEIILGGE